MRLTTKAGALRLLFALLPAGALGQNEAPTTAQTDAGASATSATSATTLSTPPPVTTALAPALPEGTATFAPLAAPSALHIPGALRDTVYAVTPAEPLPVADPADGPWLVPDYEAAWDAAFAKALAFVSHLSLVEKINMTTGVGWQNGPCVGNTPALPLLTLLEAGIPAFRGLCLQDSPLGVRYTVGVTAFPPGLTAALSWSRALWRERGHAMGAEFKAKGVHVALGPMANLGRVAEGGRNWEGFGADPWLAGEAAYETVLGMQQAGVQATAKHFINNEQEHARTWSSSAVDARTERELYAHPFLRMVMAGAASVMCSYNLVNGTYACENDGTLNTLLKQEIGFRGYVQSDWAATMSTLSASNGLDMTMPGDVTFGSGGSYFGDALLAFVANGSVAPARLDDMAARVMAGYFFLGQDQGYPPVGLYSWDPLDPTKNNFTDVRGDHDQVVREVAARGTVLLKNVNQTLPLKKPKSIALIGSDAGPPTLGPNGFVDRGGYDGVLAMGWGSGTAELPYLDSPLEALQRRARQDRARVNWHLDDWDISGAQKAVLGSDVALVFVSADSGEQYITVDGNEGDRGNLTAWKNGDALVQAVAAVHPNVVVVVHAVGPIIMEPWIEHPNVTAVVFAALPGQEAGAALVDVLYGGVNPGGKLAFTIAKNASDYPATVVRGGQQGTDVLDVQYTEGLNIDYRWFDANGLEPRFEFGFGLSYTNFTYGNLSITKLVRDPSSAYGAYEDGWDAGQATPYEQGMSAAPWLHAPAFTLSFMLANTGGVAGVEVAQAYVRFPPDSGEPPSVLRGFADVRLEKGERKQVTITLSRYALSVWDTAAMGWRRPAGEIEVWVGRSSRDATGMGGAVIVPT